MRLTLPSGTELKVQHLDDVLTRGTPGIEADALVVSATALETPGALERMARKLRESRCTLVAILGPEAERLHDALDEQLIGEGAAIEPLPTTTWHSDEDAEDILSMAEQMVLSAASRPGPRTILVSPARTDVPTSLRELIRMLDFDLRGAKPA